MEMGKYLAAGLLVASPVIAQEHCEDADVYRIGGKIGELSTALFLETTKRTPHSPGEYKRYELTPAEASLKEQISGQRSLIQKCAELGNAGARYIHAEHLERSGDMLVVISKDKTVLQDDPPKAAKAQSDANETYAEANKWYSLAAAQGYPLAMLALGHNHAVGKGFVASKSLAMEWFSKAGNQAIEMGKRDLAVICLKRMTALDPGHPLTRALMKALDDGASQK